MFTLCLLLLIAFSSLTESHFAKGGRVRRGSIYVAVDDTGILLNEAKGGEVVSSATVANGVFRLRSSFGNVRVKLTGKPFVVTNDKNGKLHARYFTKEDRRRVTKFQNSFNQQMQNILNIFEPGSLFGGFPFETKGK